MKVVRMWQPLLVTVVVTRRLLVLGPLLLLLLVLVLVLVLVPLVLLVLLVLLPLLLLQLPLSLLSRCWWDAGT